MISASERKWNSATTLYIARKLAALAQGREEPLKVLDIGCGSGQIASIMHEYGHDVYGYDLESAGHKSEATLAGAFGENWQDRFKFISNERSIPFDDNSFDVIYANQVFEHVRFLDRIMAECARVLRPDGVLVTLFPVATYPLEGHVKIPFAHWLPPGRLRINYMRIFFALRLRPRKSNRTPLESAEHWDKYLTNHTFYRLMNEIHTLADHYFEAHSEEADDYVRARLDMWENRHDSRWRQTLARMIAPLRGRTMSHIVNNYWCGVFVIERPKATPGE